MRHFPRLLAIGTAAACFLLCSLPPVERAAMLRMRQQQHQQQQKRIRVLQATACDDGDAFCAQQGGRNAYPRPTPFGDCYDSFELDCLCRPGSENNGIECDDETSCDNGLEPEDFCQQEGGPEAFPIVGLSCYDKFYEDCGCNEGYVKSVTGAECVEDTSNCNNDDPNNWCREEGGNAAYAREGMVCYEDFDEHCLCATDYINTGGECVDDPECHKDDPEEWCRDEGGGGAYAVEGKSCYDDFNRDCLCFDGYEHTGEECAAISWPENQVKYVANDFPSSAPRLERCSGDCDSDSGCASDLVCFQRSGNEAVPGCDGGENEENDYDYCVDAPTASPTTNPTFTPTLDPSIAPTTSGPTSNPSVAPSTFEPTRSPTVAPTTLSPTRSPTVAPITLAPTPRPTATPITPVPTPSPTLAPTAPRPTRRPSNSPTTPNPTGKPTDDPNALGLTQSPTQQETSNSPSDAPSGPRLAIPVLYESRYVGRFQKIVGRNCSSAAPDVVAGCTSGMVSLVTVSDPYHINCSDPTLNISGGSQMHCTTACTDGQCNDLFMGDDLLTDFGDLQKFGEVKFKCQSKGVEAAGGWFSIGADSGTCNQSAGQLGFVFQTGQLGVWCSDIGGYAYSDTLSECNSNSSSINIDGDSACTSGHACIPQDETCDDFLIDRIILQSNLDNNACILSNSGSVPNNMTAIVSKTPGNSSGSVPNMTAIVTETPEPGNQSSSTTTAQFSVKSGFHYNETACSDTKLELLITCVDGTLSLLESDDTMSCAKTSESQIECSEKTVVATRNTFVGVLVYECTTTNQTPHTKVEAREVIINCDSTIDEPVSLELQLGVLCDGVYPYDDFMYDCGETSNSFTSRTGDFACGVSGVFPMDNSPIRMHTVEIGTDFRWELFGAEACLGPFSTASVSITKKRGAVASRPTKGLP